MLNIEQGARLNQIASGPVLCVVSVIASASFARFG
jgi:hypothetical protein